MTIDLMILGLCALWSVVGFAVCRTSHQQRGIESDNIGISDFVPPGWSKARELENV